MTTTTIRRPARPMIEGAAATLVWHEAMAAYYESRAIHAGNTSIARLLGKWAADHQRATRLAPGATRR